MEIPRYRVHEFHYCDSIPPAVAATEILVLPETRECNLMYAKKMNSRKLDLKLRLHTTYI